MWSKIYLIALILSLGLMCFFTYYSYSWLASIVSPASVIEGYEYHANLSWIFLWLSSVVLLILANTVLVNSRRSWAIWTTCIYFAAFIVIRYFWLELSFFQYKRANFAWNESFSIGPFFAVFLVVLGSAVSYFDIFAVTRLQNRIHPRPIASTEEADKPNED